MKKHFLGFKFSLLALSLVLVMGCGGRKEQRAWAEKITSVAQDAMQEERAASDVEAGGYGETDGLEIPTHKGKLSETIKHRTSYVVSYNHDTKQPNWVAWKLTRSMVKGNLPRAAFMDDDEMPDPKGYKSDYYNSGFDKGHLCPAGDNKWSEKAMNDCFLMTNMCPQNHGLNAGVWNSIEQQCRNWAKKYGSVYIVCGPLFLNQQHRKIGRNKVVVPDAFFKVVLRMGKNPQAIGFICRNKSQKGKTKADFVNSVDEVERITGYDFFSKLPDNIENKVEASADISQW